jgi:hypothetical protein
MMVTIVTRDDTENGDMQKAVIDVLGNSELICAEETELLVDTARTATCDFPDVNWKSLHDQESFQEDAHVDAWYDRARCFAEED